MTSKASPPPIAIGGVGGSGTRVVAAFFRDLGYYLGDDLNEAYDNLWFTLLFKRRSILLEPETKFQDIAKLFFARMAAPERLSPHAAKLGFALAEAERLQHSREWLLARAQSFVDCAPNPGKDRWGWKEPNTHIVIERLLAAKPDLRYIHTVRHPIRMALSRNQNQLENWGPVLLDRDIAIEPRLSLSFWCAAHRRILELHRAAPGRILIVDYDRLCANSEGECREILKFAGADMDTQAIRKFKEYVWRPDSQSPRNDVDLALFDPADLAYVSEIGYPLA